MIPMEDTLNIIQALWSLTYAVCGALVAIVLLWLEKEED